MLRGTQEIGKQVIDRYVSLLSTFLEELKEVDAPSDEKYELSLALVSGIDHAMVLSQKCKVDSSDLKDLRQKAFDYMLECNRQTWRDGLEAMQTDERFKDCQWAKFYRKEE